MERSYLSLGLLTATVAMIGGSAAAQCETIDFENYAVGTFITTQYDGVAFDAWPGSCGGYGSVRPMIVSPPSGTSSGTKALGMQSGCPDFSPDYMRITFDEPQRYVTFKLGEQVTPGITFQIRAYDPTGVVLSLENVQCGAGVYRFVQCGAPDDPPLIKKIHVHNLSDFFETIDDLSFGQDPTPPTAQIDQPSHNDCACGSLNVRGIACDEDGEYGYDMLEYRLVNAAPGTAWTEIGSYTTPVCTSGSLYTWNLAAVPHGWYYLRLTVVNACGLTSTDIVAVIVSKQFGPIDVESPSSGEVVCGAVTIEGTVGACTGCFGEYVVEYRSAGGGIFKDVDPAHPTYTERVLNGNIAVWDTTALAVPDGNYIIRVTGWDECGNEGMYEMPVTVDNSAGCGSCPSDVNEDGEINIFDLLQVLADWGFCP